MQMVTKQKNWWKHSVAVLLSLALVTSPVPLTGSGDKVQAAGSESPGGISTQPVLWLKAGDGAMQDNGELTGWVDKSSAPVEFELHVPLGQEARTPKYNANGINFNPSVTFNNPTARNHYDTSAKLIGDKEITFKSGYAVYKWPESGHAGVLIGRTEQGGTNNTIILGGEGNNYATGPGVAGVYSYFGADKARNQHQIVNYEIESESSHSARLDGREITTWNRQSDFEIPRFTPVIGATLGTNSTYNWYGLNGQVAEIILYDELTSHEAAKIETYLAIKYGITLGEGNADYVATNDDIVWTANSEYKHNIAGIARDDAQGLYQKQSYSINTGTQVAIGIDTLRKTNASNLAQLANGQYLVWADNGEDLTFTQAIANTTAKYHAERVWKVQNTGHVGQVHIAIPVDAVEEDTTLLVSSSENFDISQERLLNKITLNGVDYYAAKATLTDGQYFTFAAPAPKPTAATLKETVIDDNQITLTFDKELELTTSTGGFTVEIDGVAIDLIGATFIVDPNDKTKLLIILPNGTDVTDKDVKVSYSANQGSLIGINGAPVDDFTMDVEGAFNSALQILTPTELTQPGTPTITTATPIFGGTMPTSTTSDTTTIDVALVNVNSPITPIEGQIELIPGTDEWTFIPTNPLPDGTYTLTVTVTEGNKTAVKTKTFIVSMAQTVDKEPLRAKVAEKLQIDAGGPYTWTTWANYQAALQHAEDVLNNPNATQEEVNNALAQLTAAQNALVKIGQGLSALVPSTGGGTLSPSFQPNITDYTMQVGYPTASIGFSTSTFDPNATVTTTVNGQLGTLEQIPLQVGWNTIVITVTDANGQVKQYTIRVYRAADMWNPDSGDNGNTGGGTTIPAPEEPKETKIIIHVDLEVDGENPLEKTTIEIERTTYPDGRITDFVNLTPEQALEAVEKAKQIGNTIARIVIPDVQDVVDQTTVEVPKESLQILRDNGLDLEIATDNAHIAIPNSSMTGVEDNFYFRLVPVKKASERQAIEERARAERVVREVLQSNDVHVVARPMTIETNLPSRPVVVTLPLHDVMLPTNGTERQAFLDSLAVFIEHSDGEKKVVQPEVVTMYDGKLGLRFTVEKFSTFTIIRVAQEVHTHTPYIRGFEDGTFRPEANITRAQAARMIARILGYEEGTAVSVAPFKDIPSMHFAAGEIAFVKAAGIMDGDEKGNFNASNNITRAQMAKVVANFKNLTVEENITLKFSDTKGHWAQWIIEANRDAGIISGYPDGRFAPNEAITRVQAVRMINRMLERGPLNGVPTASFTDVPTTHRAFSDIEEAARMHSYTVDANGQEQFVK
ncbi:S-layer homology domain-containing protein [Metasolibacillus meyeri]|uniref:S-layer homology domain-containing protein n=1 Tax=Metasolibacillus meyeri TaxID=1071052 RepID=A0AAW9NU14_9BACL|nr:S-layer homology domain-containing protein [Metasolibacillus meyeri]MEC1178015.1 S-layer homology domain-containing protein [Metasolibacillus meyeri]